ncbi:MAG: hypothetical protein MUO63_14205 [Desulfobulbaceae bacterium]|nr:hypothetical protein [Desulfobulbaceae bacterium]
MKLKFSLRVLFLSTTVLIASVIACYSVENKDTPLHGKFHSNPGKYEIVFRADTTVVDPGEWLKIDGYITGYGKIESAKLMVLVPEHDRDQSKLIVNYPPINGKPDQQELPVDAYGNILSFGGRGTVNPDWNEPTIFFDLLPFDLNPPTIYTEKRFEDNPPLSLKLKMLKNVRSGNYNINFIFTYFDGKSWIQTNQNIQFTVRNIFQRNESPILWIGVIAALTSIFASVGTVISPLIRMFKNKKSTVVVQKKIGLKDDVIIPHSW